MHMYIFTIMYGYVVYTCICEMQLPILVRFSQSFYKRTCTCAYTCASGLTREQAPSTSRVICDTPTTTVHAQLLS